MRRFAQLQCEVVMVGEHVAEVERLDEICPEDFVGTVTQQNEACLSCHTNNNRVGWHGSIHERRDLACVSCHKIHTEHDQVTDRAEQPQVCYRCHAERPRRLRPTLGASGSLRGNDLHVVPRATRLAVPVAAYETDGQPNRYSCHAEKRGPFLWEHPPVAEDCNNCHNSHGSTNPSLLKLRPPLLCQQCRSGHPSIAYREGLPGHTPSANLLGGSCVNCHSHVHGSTRRPVRRADASLMNDPFSTDRCLGRRLALSLTALVCAVHAGLVGAQQLPPRPDTSAWACEDCTADTGTAGSIDVGYVGADGTNDRFGTSRE